METIVVSDNSALSEEVAPTMGEVLAVQEAEAVAELAETSADTSIAIAQIEADAAVSIAETQAAVEITRIEAATDLESREAEWIARLASMEAENNSLREQLTVLQTPILMEPSPSEMVEQAEEVAEAIETETIASSIPSDISEGTELIQTGPIDVSESAEEVQVSIPLLSVPRKPIFRLV